MTITYGPFAEAAEQIGGYYLLARSRILTLALNTSYALGRER